MDSYLLKCVQCVVSVDQTDVYIFLISSTAPAKTGHAQGFYTEQSLIKTLIEETLAPETKQNLYSWIKVERVAYQNT